MERIVNAQIVVSGHRVFLSKSLHKLRKRNVLNIKIYYCRHGLFDCEFNVYPELGQEMAGVVAKHEPFLYMGAERKPVRKIKVSRQGQRAAIDECVAVPNCGAVGKGMLTPVDRLISTESRHTSI